MRKFLLLICFSSLFFVAGCAKPVQKLWSATGGSRADATVELSYEYIAEREKPILNDAEANNIALNRCTAWGYAEAEAFGGIKYEKEYQNGVWGQETRVIVTKTFQCIGKGDGKVK